MKIAILLSGAGTNMAAIAQAIQTGQLQAKIETVISDVPDAPGLRLARNLGLKSEVTSDREKLSRDQLCDRLTRLINAANPDMIVLAGFMRILNNQFIQTYKDQIINIHPSLLPKYPGLNTHRRALAAGDLIHGSSVHFVTEALDSGPIIAQTYLPIPDLSSYNVEVKNIRVEVKGTGVKSAKVIDIEAEKMLAQKIKALEYKLYPLCLNWIQNGTIQYHSGKVQLNGDTLGSTGIQLNESALIRAWEACRI